MQVDVETPTSPRERGVIGSFEINVHQRQDRPQKALRLPCGLSWAFEATGKERGEEVEWKCYACGDFKWKKVSSDDDNDWL